jgi:polyribonucleotide nucleotidyltransferase
LKIYAGSYTISFSLSSMHLPVAIRLLISAVNVVQDISGDELVKALQIKGKIPRRKALSELEDKVISILSEQGYVSKDGSSGVTESLADIVEDEDEDEDEDEIIVDGEVDEGDVHIKPVSRKPPPQVMVIVL